MCVAEAFKGFQTAFVVCVRALAAAAELLSPDSKTHSLPRFAKAGGGYGKKERKIS